MLECADVIVVGAGPVGLLAAIELRLGGVHVVVLDRLEASSMAPKALLIGPLGIEALERRGMAAEIAAAEEHSFTAIRHFTAQSGAALPTRGFKYIGHFAGLTMLRGETLREPERRGHPVNQQAAEAMLTVRAQALGVEIRRGCEFTGLVQQEEGVDVRWRSLTGEGSIHCSYLLGCDGGRSTVRKMAGFDFPGTPPTMTMYQAIVDLDHPERLAPIGWRRTANGVFSYGPFPNRLFLLDFSGPPADRDAPVTREEIEAVLRRISGADVRVKHLQVGGRWGDNTRLADTYRRGRVLIAGDAAHVHSPFGGQGMSLGLVDAANLGWKLASVIRGEMPEGLLDSYTAERRPVAEAVLANTRAQAALMRPDPQSGAMRELFAGLLQLDNVNRLIGEMMTGVASRYDLGSEREEVGRLIGNRPLSNGSAAVTLYDLMQNGMGVFLDASPDARISRFVEARTARVSCRRVETGSSMLIRPDACIAWIGEETSTAGLDEALSRWFCTGQTDCSNHVETAQVAVA